MFVPLCRHAQSSAGAAESIRGCISPLAPLILTFKALLSTIDPTELLK